LFFQVRVGLCFGHRVALSFLCRNASFGVHEVGCS
jgi:hypothetical protein